MKKTALNDAQIRADILLAEIGRLTSERQKAEASALARIEQIRQEVGQNLERLDILIQQSDTALMNLLKTETEAVYNGAEKIKLDHGVVLHTQADQVRIPRTALEAIKSAGWMEAIRTTEAVKREVVEGWPDERLVVIGATKKTVDKYSYEVKEG